MPNADGFHEYVIHDILRGIDGVSSRKMFGGWGIYRYGKIFAIIAYEQLYFKQTPQNASLLEKLDAQAFEYAKKDGKVYHMKYFRVSENALEDPDCLRSLIGVSRITRW